MPFSYFGGRMIHEHDFLPLGAKSHFVQCRTCDVVYCILCGKRIGTIVTTGDHGLGKCIKSRQVIQGYEEGEEKLQQN